MRKKQKNPKNYTDLERNNRVAILCHIILSIVMSTFCLLQTLSGMQTWGYMSVILILGFLPIVAEKYFLKRDPQSTAIKHIFGAGFLAFYTFSLFTSTNNLVFLFVIPMILIVSIYNDTRYTILINAAAILESILIIFLGARTGGFGYAGMESSIIQMVIMILVAIYSYLTAQTIKCNLTQKLKHIQHLSTKTESAIQEIYAELEKLNESSQATKSAMNDVNNGTADTAKAVQNQLLQTDAIQEKIEAVNSSAALMSENLQQTLYYVGNGNQDVSQLVANVDNAVEISSRAIEKLNTLQQHMEQMDAISKMINNIAFQINIMALNSNIEAARAGEAGRGFSVVASQISEMSLKTKDATETITTLIDSVSHAITEVVEVMDQMIESTSQEKECTSHTYESFSAIHSTTFAIRDNVEDLVNTIAQLTDANQVISNSVQTISVASEEVYALTSEVMDSENSNARILDTISAKMQKLLEETTH